MPSAYRCPDCQYYPMTWDSDGSISGLGEPCWVCLETQCGNIIPVDENYQPPT
jgi:hypothetical protein